MKIALIAPSPVPFVIGGAENLWTGWIAALNAQPGVQADLIKLPTPERNFWEIVDSYRRWAALDLTHFDRVISTKYPAWMAAHPDHHVFVQHKLRGLYDTWPAGWPTEIPKGERTPQVQALLHTLAQAGSQRAALEDIFGALDALRAAAGLQPPSLLQLPGPLIRTIVHRLDAIGLARTAIRRYAAISATVRARADYFPPGAQVEVIHHPTLPRPESAPCPQVPPGAIFTASRLDAPKRLDWIIQAYQQAARQGVRAPLVIAGDGPQRPALEALCQDQPNIHLVGRLTDAQIASAYRQALFVPFVPDREDYGLITLEALQAGRPVLTCADSGGVCELVRHGENGWITQASIPALAEGMHRLAQDDALRDALASRAAASVAHIDWPSLAAAFSQPWRKLVVVNTFPIYPAHNGGQVRMQQLYRSLSAYANITVVSLGTAAHARQRRRLQAGLTEVVIPATAEHQRASAALARQLRATCDDVAAMLHPQLTPDWLQAIAHECADADAVIACHPYGWPAIRAVWDGPVIYESLNVEADLKAAIYPDAADTLAAIARIEGECARQAPVVLCCSEEDAQRMQQRYQLAQRPAVVPNGVAAGSYPVLTAQQKAALRASLGLPMPQGERAAPQGGAAPAALAVFVGSLHGPNIDALRSLLQWADRCPDIAFAVLGSVCDAPALPPAPPNVWLVGRVSDAQLRTWLAAADAGLNPVISGSGTNLKMLEYAAAGLPILSTPFGGRGGILQAGQHYHAAEIEDFPAALERLLHLPAPERQAMVEAARQRAVDMGDWPAIAQRMWAALQEALQTALQTPNGNSIPFQKK